MDSLGELLKTLGNRGRCCPWSQGMLLPLVLLFQPETHRNETRPQQTPGRSPHENSGRRDGNTLPDR